MARFSRVRRGPPGGYARIRPGLPSPAFAFYMTAGGIAVDAMTGSVPTWFLDSSVITINDGNKRYLRGRAASTTTLATYPSWDPDTAPGIGVAETFYAGGSGATSYLRWGSGTYSFGVQRTTGTTTHSVAVPLGSATIVTSIDNDPHTGAFRTAGRLFDIDRAFASRGAIVYESAAASFFPAYTTAVTYAATGEFHLGWTIFALFTPFSASNAALLDMSENPWSILEPEGIWVPPFGAAAAAAPTLSDIKAVNITATTVQGTYDYAF